MKKILLPTDFSGNSWNAIEYAVALFKNSVCTFFLLNAYSEIEYESVHISDIPSERATENTIRVAAIKNLEHIKTTVEKIHPNPKHSFEIVAGLGLLTDVTQEIVKREKIDLVIMGTKGATGAKEVFLGSNTVRMINRIKNCPVLGVPESFTFGLKPLEIIFATDFNHFYSREELVPLLDIATSFHAIVRIVYVQKDTDVLTEEQKFNLEMLQTYLKGIKNYQHTLVNSTNSIAESLTTFAENMGVHLIAMLYYKHGFIEKLTREPVINTVSFHTRIPFLILPESGMSASFSSTLKSASKLYNG
ncbi:universal stress protein [Aquimarina sp. RZ0]|uniref:universal stress protein n=1 Tax=Aquimarina sp. RZ0 TaxID=2607730 RepID=UPI0011F266CF|nr:universal stress protein [Aquimarina sp. RZ0]KAA1247386.1 universal stress protein [Aquimarina sp. RZ0]